MENVTENNKLIAEFIGRKGKQNKNLYWVNIPNVDWVAPEEMKFHEDWNWLMPVIDKIETILPDDSTVHIEFNRCWIDNNKEGLTIDACRNTRLDSVYYAVLEFIEWYNEHKEA